MSWNHPEPPIFGYWAGLLILTLVTLTTGGLLYLLLG